MIFFLVTGNCISRVATPGAQAFRRLPPQPRHHHRADHARLQRTGVPGSRPARHRPHACCRHGRARRSAIVLRGREAGYVSVGDWGWWGWGVWKNFKMLNLLFNFEILDYKSLI